MKFKNSLWFCFIAMILISCTKAPTALGDKRIAIFEDVNLHFNPTYQDLTDVGSDSIYRLDAGRVVLKKIKLPTYELQPQITVNLTLTSNGDPWDKSGSMFVIPATSELNLLDFQFKNFDLTTTQSEYPAVVGFSKDNQQYLPEVELVRFMTPFGIGHYSDTTNQKYNERKPLYIPAWEKEIIWEQDITQLLPLLEGEVYIGVFIDTWTKDGYNISAELNFEETKIAQHKKEKTTVVPIANTVKYASQQRNYDRFYASNLTASFEIPENAKNAKLYYITTGHGGHSAGDEFVKKRNIVKLDDQVVMDWIPWRDDCASFRRYNPSSGIWVRKTTYQGQEIDERISSSDFSRSNWCPGSQVLPQIVSLESLKSGKHNLEILIPEAQQTKEGENNYWMVSSYLVYEN